MDFNSSTPTVALTINDVELQAISPFNEGHVCNANEAAVLNQTLRENLRNNMAAAVKKLVEGGATAAALQEALDKYTAGYAFGVRKSGGGGQARTSDPVLSEARKLARERVTGAIKAKGYKIKDIPAEQVTAYINQLLVKDPSIMEKAKQIVALAKDTGDDELDLSGITTKPAQAA